MVGEVVIYGEGGKNVRIKRFPGNQSGDRIPTYPFVKKANWNSD